MRTNVGNEAVAGPDPLLSIADVAQQLSVNTRTVEGWIKSGLFSAMKVGPRIVRVRSSAVDALMCKWESPSGSQLKASA